MKTLQRSFKSSLREKTKRLLGKELFECLEKLEGIQERDTMERLTFEDGEQDDTLLKIQKLTSEFLCPSG